MADEESAWAKQGREAIQGSHSLITPLARWTRELAEAEGAASSGDAAAAESEPKIAIPELVLQVRPHQRLPEDAVCRSPIAGMVIAVMAVPGQAIARREAVLIIEAMKMQNHVSSEVDGTIKAVLVATGDAVKAGQVLFELE